ncbi:hypothetical protein [Micromonospora sp. NPDC047187]
MEATILDHRAEPALDLGRQTKEAVEVPLFGKSDDLTATPSRQVE